MMGSDADYMKMALAEGRKALPACLPNPPVGCVVVDAGKVVAKGHTQEPGNPHAEAMALSIAPDDLSNATVYVTLEPCSFQGRTPSCARALVMRGVKRVVVALLDPDYRNNGAGITILKDAGICVEVGLLSSYARTDLGSYLND